RPGVDEIGCGLAATRIHAHIERAVVAEGETALRFVELEGGDAEIEGDAVGFDDAVAGEEILHLGEAAVDQREPAFEAAGRHASALDCRCVVVDRVNRAAGAREQRRGIAAAAEGGIDVDRVIARGERGHHLFEHHGNVAAHAAPPPEERAARARARRSFCTGSKRTGSQIWNFWPKPMNITRSLMPAWAMNSSGSRIRPSSSKFRNWVGARIA